jgi:hypothetical protein
MPRRNRRPPAILLMPGQWNRWRINYRFTGSCGGDWSYRLDTLNLAFGRIPVGLFLDERPTSLTSGLPALTGAARAVAASLISVAVLSRSR